MHSSGLCCSCIGYSDLIRSVLKLSLLILLIFPGSECFSCWKKFHQNVRLFSTLSSSYSPEVTKNVLITLIDSSWQKVKTSLNPETLGKIFSHSFYIKSTTSILQNLICCIFLLVLCENDLKSATALLVLATIKHSANEFKSSQAALQYILSRADSNSDGELTYVEWFQWLENNVDNSTSSAQYTNINNVTKGFQNIGEFKAKNSNISPDLSFRNKMSDPMINNLEMVLGHAICTL